MDEKPQSSKSDCDAKETKTKQDTICLVKGVQVNIRMNDNNYWNTGTVCKVTKNKVAYTYFENTKTFFADQKQVWIHVSGIGAVWKDISSDDIAEFGTSYLFLT